MSAEANRSFRRNPWLTKLTRAVLDVVQQTAMHVSDRRGPPGLTLIAESCAAWRTIVAESDEGRDSPALSTESTRNAARTIRRVLLWRATSQVDLPLRNADLHRRKRQLADRR